MEILWWFPYFLFPIFLLWSLWELNILFSLALSTAELWYLEFENFYNVKRENWGCRASCWWTRTFERHRVYAAEFLVWEEYITGWFINSMFATVYLIDAVLYLPHKILNLTCSIIPALSLTTILTHLFPLLSITLLHFTNPHHLWRHVQAVSRGSPIKSREVSDPVDSAYKTRILG